MYNQYKHQEKLKQYCFI